MADKWLKDIHDRMADFETNEPDGLWEGIQTKLPYSADDIRKADKPLLWLWMKRVGTVAAAVAIVAMVIVRLHIGDGDKDDMPLLSDVTDIHDVDAKVDAHIGQLQENQAPSPEKSLPRGGNGKYGLIAGLNKKDDAVSSASEHVEADSSETATREDMSSNTQKKEAPEGNKRQKQSYSPEKIYYARERHTGYGSGRMSLGIFAAGGMSAALNGRAMGENEVVGTGSDGVGWKDNPMLGILLYNQGKEIETHISHKQPVRMGLSFAYNLNECLSLESGLTYTILSSDIREGSTSHYFTGEQTLHYIGVPFNMKYKVYSWNKLNMYASAGMLIEKRVAGKMEKEYVLENKTEKIDKENVESKPIQLSANIAAGLQYNLTSAVALYAEPGVSYYFDDNSSVQTIYKEKPLNFNFNFGVRFTFGE